MTLQREGRKDGKAYACTYFVFIKVDQDFTIKIFPSRSQLYCKLLPRKTMVGNNVETED